MIRLLAALTICLIPSLSWGLSCNSARSGVWSNMSTAVWTAPCSGSGVPGVGAFANYSANIISGHTIRITGSRTIPATTMTGSGSTYSTLQVDGGTVTLAGNLRGNGSAAFIQNAGTALDMAGKRVISATATYQRWRWYLNGTANGRVTISSSAPGSYIGTRYTLDDGEWLWNYATVDDSFGYGLTGADNSIYVYNGKWIWDHVIWKNNSRILSENGLRPAASLKFTNCDFVSNSSTTAYIYSDPASGAVSGLNAIDHITVRSNLSGQSSFYVGRNGISVSNSVFFGASVSLGGNVSSLYNSILFTPENAYNGANCFLTDTLTTLSLHDNIFIGDSVNWHGITINSTSTSLTTNLYDNVFEGPDGASNHIMPGRYGCNVYGNIHVGNGTPWIGGLNPPERSATRNIYNNTYYTLGDGGDLGVEPFSTSATLLGTFNVYNNLCLNRGNSNEYVQNEYSYYYPESSFTGTGTLVPTFTSGESRATPAKFIYIKITGTGTPNTFQWKHGINGTWSSDLPVSTSATTLLAAGNYGGQYGNTIKVTFNGTTGGVIDDSWVYSGNRSMINYYDIVDYNAFHNYTAYNPAHYRGVFISDKDPGDSGFGLHDVDLDPQFKNKNANVSTYDALMGGPGTRANFTSEMLKLNGYGGEFDPRYSASNVIAYMRDAFTPQNPLLLSAGQGGTYIGAVQPAISTGINPLWFVQ